MAIDKKLIHFKQWSTFISSQGVNGNYTTPSSGTAGSGSALYGQIKETSIVFIQDVQRIWTHGKLYECSAPDLSAYLTAEDLSDLNAFVEKCSVTKTGSGNGETLTVTVGDSSNSITNTWRTVQVNGSSIGDNILNLKAGTNITLSKSNGTVTITGASFPTSLPANGGTADKADVLTTARTIDGVDFNGSANITHYGTCSTSAGTAAKTVSLTGYKLATGAKVAVKFTVTNTAANPTLNVNSTGAKAIYYRGAAISKGYLAANRVYEFVYDGTNYELIGDINTDTNTKVTTEANHYTPTATATDLSADAVAGTASWDVPVVTGVNLQRDSKGHIVGITVDSVNTPAKPTDNNTAHSHSVGAGLSASGSGGTSGTTTYSLKTAAADEIGGIKVASVGTAASGANTTVNANKFAVHVDSNGLGYVAIPQYSNNSGDITGVTAGKGLTGGATSGTATLNVGAGTGITVADDSVSANLNSTTSLGTIGTTDKLYAVGVDANGKLAVNVPWTDTDTDTKVTSVGNHYTPAENTSAAISASGGSNANITGTTGKLNVITGLKRDAKGHIVGVTSANIYSTDNNDNTAHAHTAGIGLAISGSGGTSGTTTYSANLKDATALTIDATAAATTSGRVYPVAVDKSGYLAVNVPWKNDDTKSFTITASASDDDVVVLSGTNGTNKVTYSASHAKKLGDGKSYTSGNTTTSISGSGASGTIKIPQITVDEYGHVRAAADESITITMPTIPTALKNPNALTFGSKTYDGSAAKTITAADLGLGTALKFHGTSKTAITDGSKTQTVTLSDNSSHTAENGCVLFYGNKEFVWNGSSWEELGNEGNYKVKQTAVSSPTASGNTTAFIDTISQNENGVISATKKYITNNVTYTGTLVDEQVAVFEGTSGQIKASGYTIAKSVPSDAKFTDTNTHYTSKNIIGASSSATANAAASNGSVWLNHLEESTVKSSHNIVGAGSVTVASDANGKITITGTDTNTDTKVTSVGNHYTPSADSNSQLSVDASSTTAATWNSTSLVTGVNIQRDAKGHVTGVTVDSIKMPANPNTDTNTHWTTRLYAGASGTAANAAASNPYLKVTDDNTYRNQVRFVGSGTVSVNSDASGNITISGTAHPTSLKNPTSISFKNSSNTTVSYDGSSALDLTGGVYYAVTAGKAPQLTTARTIWGQSFDGTGNISGTLSSVNNIYPNSSAEKYIGTSDNPFKYVYAEWFGAGKGKPLSFGANNGTHIWVTTSGNVGINNTNPTSKLHVTGGITATLAEYPFHADMPASTATYRHAFAGYAALTQGQYATIEVGHSSKARNAAYLGYYHDGDGSNANRLTLGMYSVDNVFNITAAGNVGIGTTAPASKLHVAGNITTSGLVKIKDASIIYDSTQKCIKFTF